jgi:hypothetical protein
MADHSPSATTRILEGIFAPFRENYHPTVLKVSLSTAPNWGGEQ